MANICIEMVLPNFKNYNHNYYDRIRKRQDYFVRMTDSLEVNQSFWDWLLLTACSLNTATPLFIRKHFTCRWSGESSISVERINPTPVGVVSEEKARTFQTVSTGVCGLQRCENKEHLGPCTRKHGQQSQFKIKLWGVPEQLITGGSVNSEFSTCIKGAPAPLCLRTTLRSLCSWFLWLLLWMCQSMCLCGLTSFSGFFLQGQFDW